jgi:hypothetical protein
VNAFKSDNLKYKFLGGNDEAVNCRGWVRLIFGKEVFDIVEEKMHIWWIENPTLYNSDILSEIGDGLGVLATSYLSGSSAWLGLGTGHRKRRKRQRTKRRKRQRTKRRKRQRTKRRKKNVKRRTRKGVAS